MIANCDCVLLQIASSRRGQPDQFQEYHNQQMMYNYDYQQRPLGAQHFNYLRLIWSEQDINLEYTLRFNTTRRGFWISAAPQKGSVCMAFKSACIFN